MPLCLGPSRCVTKYRLNVTKYRLTLPFGLPLIGVSCAALGEAGLLDPTLEAIDI